ncbi:MAG: transcriptional repressor [Clostridia bacterium]|nr:transcriptional repressor [Clostridia bacterium]
MQERWTKQKSVIYDTLKSLDHPTATEVYGLLHDTYPSVSRATVFRVLSGFAASGKALELRVAGTDVRYDYNVEKHCHVHCKKCGRVADIFTEDTPLPKLTVKGMGFTVDSCTMEFFGTCENCVTEMQI